MPKNNMPKLFILLLLCLFFNNSCATFRLYELPISEVKGEHHACKNRCEKCKRCKRAEISALFKAQKRAEKPEVGLPEEASIRVPTERRLVRKDLEEFINNEWENGLEASAKLENLPSGFPDSLPDSIKEKVCHKDKKLLFKGLMTEDEKGVLLELAPNDPLYTKAVEELFLCSYLEKVGYIETFAKDADGKDGLLVEEGLLKEFKSKQLERVPILPSGVEPGLKLSFIHLSDVQLHDEKVWMFSPELTRFFDQFVESFEHDVHMVFYDYSYYLTLIGTMKILCRRLPEQKLLKPSFMIHTGDAIDMGVVSELYEFIHITNKLEIPWYNVLGNHDYPVYGNLDSRCVGVIKPNMGFQTVNSRYSFINMHGKGHDVDPLLYFSPSNAPHPSTFGETCSVYNGFDRQGKSFTVDGSLRDRRNKPCSEEKCPGYYYFEAKEPDGEPGILCIVLDTTIKKLGAQGTLYREEDDEAFVKLENLPQGVEFTNSLEDKIRYDKDRKLLIFKGFMTEGEKSKLLESSSDNTYREAVKELFLKSQRDYKIKWLEDILKKYSPPRGKWMVLVFGHHPLGDFFDDSSERLESLFLEPGNNVIAYFCGHTHEHKIKYHENRDNREIFGFWEIITDSIFEYPKKGSLVTIRCAKDGKWEIALRSFWPYFLESLDITNAPELLKNAKACLHGSKNDAGGRRCKRFNGLDRINCNARLRFNYPKTRGD